MTRSRRHSRPRRAEGLARLLALPLLGLGLTAAGTGCVTRGTHREVVTERDELLEAKALLERRAELLERSNQSLDAERGRLLDDLEDLRQTRQTLERDVAKLTRSRDLLTEHLRTREAEVEELASLKGTYESLVNDLEAEVSAGQIEIEQLREGLRLNLAQEILFPSGSAELNASGVEVLRKVSGRLASLTHRVEVQGHTDSIPIRRALAQRYPTNWELAAARASRVVRLLEEAGVAADRLVAVSYGPNRPVAPNDTPANRALNRRIEIRMTPTPDAPPPS